MQPVQVRPEDHTLHAEILSLLQRCFSYMDGRIDPPSSVHRLTGAGIAKTCAEGEVWSIGRPAAACVFLTPKPHALYLGKLAVDDTHRGEGLASALVAVAAERSRALGLPTLELESRIELTEVHAAFTRLGFHKTAEHAHAGYDRPTEIVMQMAL